MKETRLRRLREYMESRKLSVSDLVARTGKSQPYLSDLLRGEKSFGEKTARALEESLGLSSGYLDADDAPDWRDIAKHVATAWDMAEGSDRYAQFVLEVERLYTRGKQARAGGASSTPHDRDKRTEGQSSD